MGSPTRPNGTIRSTHARPSGDWPAVIGVRMNPGATALTRTPRGPRSIARHSVASLRPAFAAL